MGNQEDSQREVFWPLEEEAVPHALEGLFAST
jgi:hypothetical protein